MATLETRVTALEATGKPSQSGLVLVRKFEAVEDAIKRHNLTDDTKRRGLVLIPEKDDSRQ